MAIVLFDKNTKKTIRGFPKGLKVELGKLLMVLQQGVKLSMPTSRPMDNVFKGLSELRLKDEEGNYRVFYYTKVKGKIIVPHAFTKKSQKTEQKEIKTAINRLKKILEEEGIG